MTTKNTTTDLVTTGETYAPLQVGFAERAQAIASALAPGEQLGVQNLDHVNIRGTAFARADGSAVNEVVGIIIKRQMVRRFYADTDPDNSPPDCFSDDYEHGSAQSDDVVARFGLTVDDCLQCPLAQWGSDDDGGRGKRCKEYSHLYLFEEGQLLPTLLRLPPTSQGGVQSWWIKNLSYNHADGSPGFPWHQVTKVVLEPKGQTAVAKFEPVGVLGAEGRALIDEVREDVLPWLEQRRS